jgi:hypothetical protein
MTQIAAAMQRLNEVRPFLATLNSMEQLFQEALEVEALVAQRDALRDEVKGLEDEREALKASLEEQRHATINAMNQLEEDMRTFRAHHGEEMGQLHTAKGLVEAEIAQQRIECEAVLAQKRQTEESIQALLQKLALGPTQGGPTS